MCAGGGGGLQTRTMIRMSVATVTATLAVHIIALRFQSLSTSLRMAGMGKHSVKPTSEDLKYAHFMFLWKWFVVLLRGGGRTKFLI